MPIEKEEIDFLPLLNVDEESQEVYNKEQFDEVLPMLALKNTVMFPGVIIPVTIGREKSIFAVQEAYEGNKNIAILTQKDPRSEDPTKKDLFQMGVVAKILKLIKMLSVLLKQLKEC